MMSREDNALKADVARERAVADDGKPAKNNAQGKVDNEIKFDSVAHWRGRVNELVMDAIEKNNRKLTDPMTPAQVQDQIDTLQKNAITLHDTINKQRSEIGVYRDQSDMLKSENDNIVGIIDVKDKEVASLHGQTRSLREANKVLREANARLTKTIDMLRSSPWKEGTYNEQRPKLELEDVQGVGEVTPTSAANYWYNKYYELKAERDKAIADSDAWRQKYMRSIEITEKFIGQLRDIC